MPLCHPSLTVNDIASQRLVLDVHGAVAVLQAFHDPVAAHRSYLPKTTFALACTEIVNRFHHGRHIGAFTSVTNQFFNPPYIYPFGAFKRGQPGLLKPL
jgi:hypothetical protein